METHLSKGHEALVCVYSIVESILVRFFALFVTATVPG